MPISSAATIPAVTGVVISSKILLSIIGSLVFMLIGVLSFMFKSQIKGLWNTVNKHADKLDEQKSQIHELEKVSIKIDGLDKGISELKEDFKETTRELKADAEKAQTTRATRDSELFGKMDDLKDFMYKLVKEGGTE